MTDAYVHVVVEPSAVTPAAKAIQAAESVETVHLVTGDYDLVARLSLDSKDDIARAVTEDIHSVSGVVETNTSVAFEV